MLTVIVSFLFIAIVLILMSIGVMLGRKPIQGSCGGLNTINGMDECELCGGSISKCDSLKSEQV